MKLLSKSHATPKDPSGAKASSDKHSPSRGVGTDTSSVATLAPRNDETLKKINACMARDGDDCLDLYLPASPDAAKIIAFHVQSDLWDYFRHSKESYVKKLGSVVNRACDLATGAPPGAFDAIVTATMKTRDLLQRHRFALDEVRSTNLFDPADPRAPGLSEELAEHLLDSADTLEAAKAVLSGNSGAVPTVGKRGGDAREGMPPRDAQSRP